MRTIPARQAVHEPWPDWAHPDLVPAYGSLGIHEPYRHQIQAADLAHAGEHVVIATGTASGKSLAYQLPGAGRGPPLRAARSWPTPAGSTTTAP